MPDNSRSDAPAFHNDIGTCCEPQVGLGADAEEDGRILLPTRIITYAWGEKYVGELLSLTLPALLAPGNLPHVAATVPCELIILTEQVFFPRLLADPAVVRVQEFCPVRLLPLDDLVSEPDKYGMALTYVLHRGFADIGPTVTDRWLMFLNADFVLADGSLKNLLDCLAAGERLVAAPSYCANSEAVVPVLLRRIDPQTRTLALPPRELASLVMRNRHNTIRGKTVNQSLFSIRYMDQFYWEVDSDTLLGHQMPIAIVGMRPERHLPEPNSYWDHGLMREFVPNALPCVLADSDDFLMLEFRGERTAEDQLRLGWPEPAEIARNARSFLTHYQREMAKYPLTLHARDVPAHLDEERRRLRAYVDSVLTHTPSVLPSHLDHPQWDYHRPGFIKGRHEYLSRRLGRATETNGPPAGLGELDRMWWKLDGLKKSYEWRHSELTRLRDHQRAAVASLGDRLGTWISERRDEIDNQLTGKVNRIAVDNGPDGNQAAIDRMLRPLTKCDPSEFQTMPADPEEASSAPLVEHAREWLTFEATARCKQESVAKTLELVDRLYQNRIAMLDLEFESASRQLRFDYDRLVQRRVISAAIPYVAIRHGPQPPSAAASDTLSWRIARRIYHRLFCNFGRYTKIHPYWAPMRHLVRAVDRTADEGARNVLVVVGRDGIADRVADTLPGLHAQVSLAEVLQGNLAAAFNRVRQIDLCLYTLDQETIYRFSDIVRSVAPCVREGGRIVGFYPNLALPPLPIVDARLLRGLFDCPGSARVYYAGSVASARVMLRYRKALYASQRGRKRRIAHLAAALLMLAPRAFAANRAEDLNPDDERARVPDPCSSLTIEVTV